MTYSLAMCFQKSNNLDYSMVLESHGLRLANEPGVANDVSLLSLVRAQHIGEKIQRSLQSQNHLGVALNTAAFQIDLHFQIFENEALEWRNTMSHDTRSLCETQKSRSYSVLTLSS